MKNNIKNPGYCTITYKNRLMIKDLEYLKLTKNLYNEMILKYYNLLLEHFEFLNLSNQYCLRELEKLTITDRQGNKPKDYFELDVPMYFRRAAINQSIGSVRSYFALLKKYEDDVKEGIKDCTTPTKAKAFDASPLFYKGMYKNFSMNRIDLKLFNGEKWTWYKCKIHGRKFDVESAMSPTVVVKNEYATINIPVRIEIDDVKPVKERMKEKDLKILSLSFSNQDSFIICVILDKKGTFIKSKFIHGGKEYKFRTKKVLNQIKKHRNVNSILQERDHKTYWQKLDRISSDFAHKVSKEILEFAKENNVKVISVSEQDELSYITRKVGKYSPIYLRHKILDYLKYKSFKDSILVTKVRSNYTASRCYKCRGKIKKENTSESICENGHKSNYYFNTAMNVGLMGLKKFGNI